MALRLRPKTFGPVFVSYDGSEVLLYAHGDPSRTSPHPPAATPVDTMIASLASCIVRSVEWAAGQQKAVLGPFQVKVVALKSTDLPGRVETAEITVIGQLVEDAALAEAIIKQAKSICTVSNSLTTAVTITHQPAP